MGFQLFSVASPDPPEIRQRRMLPQQAAVAFFVQLRDAHTVLVGGDVLGLNVHRDLGEIEVAADARCGRDAGRSQNVLNDAHGEIVGRQAVQLQIGRCIKEDLVYRVAVDVLRRDVLEVDVIDFCALGDVVCHLRRRDNVVQLPLRVSAQIVGVGRFPGKTAAGGTGAPPDVDLAHLLHDLEQPRATGDTVSLQRGGHRKTDGLLSAGGICHDKVRRQRVEVAFDTFDRGVEGFQVDGHIDFSLRHEIPPHMCLYNYMLLFVSIAKSFLSVKTVENALTATKSRLSQNRDKRLLAGVEGFEPSARGFGDRCSTN